MEKCRAQKRELKEKKIKLEINDSCENFCWYASPEPESFGMKDWRL